MLVRCPQCGAEFRLTEINPGERVLKYLCPDCHDIVQLDLEKDEIRSSSSSTHFSTIDRRKNVLVVDDARSIRETANMLLSAAGYNVHLAADGDEALKLIGEKSIDLILLDLLMPNKTGFDVLAAVLEDEKTSTLPIIVMSAVYEESVIQFLQQKGIRGFLDKSQLGQTLVFRVRQILEPEAED
jgi:CheY-like chemotaxis protein